MGPFCMGDQKLVKDDVVRALLDTAIVVDVQERRVGERFACFGGISVSAFETFGSEGGVVSIPAVTDSISQGGLSFLCPRLLRVETPLSIRFETLQDRPVLECVVRRVVHLGGEYHRIGAEFAQ